MSDEEGSISVLTIGLFLVAVSLLTLITDLAAVSVAKQSLVHATESAAIRAVQTLDLGSYYRGDAGVAVPIDCPLARQKVMEELGLWMQSDTEIRRPEIQQLSLTNFLCSGNRVQLSTSAEAVLPFRLPSSSASVEIHATVEAQSDRAR